MKSLLLSTSGTIAFLNLPILASKALRPSKKTTSSPRSSTNLSTSYGFRCFPPFTTPFISTSISAGLPKATSSSFTRTFSLGKSFPVPDDHLKSIFLKPGYFLVVFTYFLSADISPPTVPLIPCFETKILPLMFNDSQSACCHKRTASGSAIGVKP